MLTLKVSYVISGFWGDLYQPISSGFGHEFFTLVDVVCGIAIVMIPASFAISDPPSDVSAHWRTLPVRAGALLISKLFAVLLFFIFPLCLTHLAIQFWTGTFMWSHFALLELAEIYPGWVLLGFALGAATGNWKGFSMLLVLFLAGLFLINMILIALVNDSYIGYHASFLNSLQLGLSESFTNNLFLPGAVAVIILCYYTRISGFALVLIFLISIPLGIKCLPQLTILKYVPSAKTAPMMGDSLINIEYDLPKKHQLKKLNDQARLVGVSTFSDLSFNGFKDEHFLMPRYLEVNIQGAFESNPSVTNRFDSRWRFIEPADLNFFHPDSETVLGYHLHERFWFYPRLENGIKILNLPTPSEEGFELWNLEQSLVEKFDAKNEEIHTAWFVQPYRIVELGDLDLRKHSELSHKGTSICLTALLAEAGNRTQLKLNVMGLSLRDSTGPVASPWPTNTHDSRWGSANLRFVLINETSREMYVPVTFPVLSPMHTVCQVGYHSVLLNFSRVNDSDESSHIPVDWLSESKLRVYRIIAGAGTRIHSSPKPINLETLPIKP